MEHLCSFVKRLFEFRSTVIDNCIFRLHYKITFPLLLGLSILVGWRQNFGDAMSCTSKLDLPSNFINQFCFSHSTYSYEEAYEKKLGKDIPYPGMDKYSPSKTKTYHTYYQWVSLVLFIQAVLFLMPRCFWKCMESGRIQDIVKDLGTLDVGKDDLRQDKIRSFTRRLQSEFNQNRTYVMSYAMAEIFNVVNVIGQIHLMNVFLRGKFESYGLQMLHFSDTSPISNKDPSMQLFPRVAQCEFHSYDPTGDVQRTTIMCMLPINDLNAKIYAFLWFWFVFLVIVSCISLVSTLVFCLFPAFRLVSLRLGTSLVQREHVRDVVSKSSTSDCFLIRILSQNLSSADFRDVVEHLANASEKRLLED